MTSFDDLGLSEKALDAVRRLGYTDPTPVQEQAIPLALAGRDLIAAAKTGTGKTAAFLLPSLDKLGRAKKGGGPLMLVVTPTRELAQQIGEVCETIAASTRHRILTVVGGLSYNPQIERLKHGVDVLIATPGRLVDLMDQGAANLGNVEVLVLDEADRMLDMGFLPAMRKIVAATPKGRQTLLFSATVDDAVRGSVGTLLHDPAYVEIAHRGETADTVDQFIVRVPHACKPALLKAVLEERGADRVIVFARTRGRADSCARRLRRAGFTAEAIHSDRSQNQRRRALDAFSSGKVGVIVATDVLARGIDVEQVDYVVNFDLPTQPEDYVHRIGRTGRAGARGYAISFVSPETSGALKDIQKLTKQEIPEIEIAGFDLEAAEADVMARTMRATAKRDPEVAKAAKELKAKERKKAKGSGAATKGETPSKKGGSAKGETPCGSKKVAAKGAAAGQKKAAAAKKPQRSGGRAGGASASASASAAKSKRSGADMRPGRAHRAAVERQRARGSRGGGRSAR